MGNNNRVNVNVDFKANISAFQSSLQLMKNGWIESLYAMKSKGNVPKSQIKLPLIITEKPDKEYIL